MIQKKRKIIRIGIIVILAGMLIGGGTLLYLFNMPHRNVQNTSADYSLSSSQLVNEYLENSSKANEKYLSEDGNSKVLKITGVVANIKEDFNGHKVVLLKENNDKAGVSCTFTKESNNSVSKIKIGDTVTIKGVIISGSSYDEDLDMYENVIIEKSNILLNNH